MTGEPTRFRSAKLKIERAYKHIRELEEWCNAFIENDRRISISEDGAYQRLGPPLLTFPPFYVASAVGPLIGDAAHNLRSALDHVAYEIVTTRGKDASGLYFPMSDRRKSLVGSKDYRLIESVAPHLASLIADEIKPYLDGGNNGFWFLNKLDRVDKHRAMIFFTTHKRSASIKIVVDELNDPPAPPGVFLPLFDPRPLDGQGHVEMHQKPLTPGSPAYVHNQQYGYATVEICFGKGEVFEDQPVVPAMHQLAQLVSGVISALEVAEAENVSSHGHASRSAATPP